jgi:DNA polymerase-3 subunit alpha (Gram-positive type)
LKNLYELLGNETGDIGLDFSGIYIKGIKVNKSTHQTKISVISNTVIENGNHKKLKELLKNKFSIKDLVLDIEYEMSGSDNEIISRNRDAIIGLIEEKSALLSNMISKEQIICMDNKILINILDANKEFIKKTGIEKTITEYFEKNFDLNIEVIIKVKQNGLDNKYIEYKKKEEDRITELHIKENDNKESYKKSESKIINTNSGNGNSFKRRRGSVVIKKIPDEEKIKIDDIDEYSGSVIIEGEILKTEQREIKGGRTLIIFDITDLSSSVTCKFFSKNETAAEYLDIIKSGNYIKVKGDVQFDTYQKEITVFVKALQLSKKEERMDESEEKRIELHLHTQMSSMDGLTDIKKLIKRASDWGHEAVAITDHGVVQAFPDAYIQGKNHNVKIIYGVECYLLDDTEPVAYNQGDIPLDGEFVVVDIETTGLNPEIDKITEIACIRIKNGGIQDSFTTLVNPEKEIPFHIEKLTGITNEMVSTAPTIDKVMKKFFNFTGDAPVIAHNAAFDISFLKFNSRLLKRGIENPVIDTLALTKEMFKELKSHRLSRVAGYLGISIEKCHRAMDDAAATAKIFIKCVELLKNRDIHNFRDMQEEFDNINDIKTGDTYHAIILVRNYKGLKNLYRIISESHINYYYKKPRVPKKLLMKYREGLLLGSACEAGELYKAFLNKKPVKEISRIIRFYDYLEIQPLGNNGFMIDKQIVESWDILKKINKKIVKAGERFGKPVVATCDTHFLDPVDEYYRRILMAGQKYEDADKQAPLYYRTTQEMLDEFNYLDSDIARKVVIEAPGYINSLIEDIKPIPDGTFPPVIEGAETQIREISERKAIKMYGDELPGVVKERMEKELNSIITHGFSVMYIIAMKLVKKSLDDGYLVGSRGSVGSSFVAFLLDITEVNSLPPHYRCPECLYSEFLDDGEYDCGFDIPYKKCPKCDTELIKDGYDIPFETFLGFQGDKEPDIDLNFSGEYQPRAHKYTEELFGRENVYRAGTISTIASKTAFGFVKGYLTDRGIIKPGAEINRLVSGCEGVKRTTGQHPGGVMIVPKDKDIYDFTPVQRPADDNNTDIITTHFDYHSISGRLLKLDILGHDDPTVIKMLEDITGVDAKTIPIAEETTMGIFCSTKPLGIKEEDIKSPVGTFGIPEFGTKFVRQMLVDTKPTTFSELIRISGLSHGTDVWLNNAKDLIKDKTAVLKEVICTRDDIMLYLMHMGIEPIIAFKIMEDVRKGKGLKPEYEKVMRENFVPKWYIKSCNTIKYMFPKAHAAAYVMMAFRIAWFKVYHPEAFYAAYFTVRADDFDASLMTHGKDKVESKIKELEGQGNDISQKDKNVLTILEVVNEMYARNIKFLPVDIYESDIEKFIITENGIRPPLNALQGLGKKAALNIVEARKSKKEKFKSIDELKVEARVTKAVIEIMQENGCLEGLPESNQISFFDM